MAAAWGSSSSTSNTSRVQASRPAYLGSQPSHLSLSLCFVLPGLPQGQAARLPAVPVRPQRQLRRVEGHSHRRQPPGSHQRAAGGVGRGGAAGAGCGAGKGSCGYD